MTLRRIAQITQVSAGDTLLAEVTVNDFLTGGSMSPGARHPWLWFRVTRSGTICETSAPTNGRASIELAREDPVSSYGHRVFVYTQGDDAITGSYEEFTPRKGGAYTVAADDAIIRRMRPQEVSNGT